MPTPIRYPIRPAPPKYPPKVKPTPQQTSQFASAVLAMVDNPSNPQVATVYINNTLPPDDGYKIPSNLGVTFQEAPNPFADPPAGVAYYNNTTTLDGGSNVTVDVVNKIIVHVDQGVSNAAPVNPSQLFQYIRHDGAYNTTGNFQNPGPIDNTQLQTMPTAIKNSGPTVTSSSATPPSSQGAAEVLVPYSFTVSDWTSGSKPSWLGGVKVFSRVHGDSAISDNNYYKAQASTTFNTQSATLSAAYAHDLGVAYVDTAGVMSAITWPAGLSNINVQAAGYWTLGNMPVNLIVDSNFMHVTSGSAAANTGSNDPYWNFYWIDGASFFIGAGGYQSSQGIANYLGVRPGDSSRDCMAQSTAIPVTVGQAYNVQGYIDASTCSGNAPAIEICDSTGNTIYKTVSQTPGKSGIVSGSWTCPTGVSQVTVRFRSYKTTIGSSILVFAVPMFNAGPAGPYVPGPSTPQAKPATAPPTSSPAGDGGTSSGGGPADPNQNPGEITHPVLPSPVKGRIQEDGTLDVGSGTQGSVINNLPHANHSTAVQAVIDSAGTLDVSTARSGKILPYANHHAAVTGALNPTADSFSSYVKPGQVHGGTLAVQGQPGGTNLLYNPTGAAGLSGWTAFSGNQFSYTTDDYGGGRFYCQTANVAARTEGYYQIVSIRKNVPMVIQGIIDCGTTSGGPGWFVQIKVVGQQSNTVFAQATLNAGSGPVTRLPWAFAFTTNNTDTQLSVQWIINNGGTNTLTATWAKLQLEYNTQPSLWVDHSAAANHNKVFNAAAQSPASTFLNPQGSMGVVGGAPSSLPYSSTSSSVTLNLPAVTFTRADQSTLSIGALSPQFAGLGASKSYYVNAGIDVANGMWKAYLSATQYSGTQLVTNGVGFGGDGFFPVFSNATVTTSASGTTGGGSGGLPPGGTGNQCPAVWQRVDTREKGYVRADQVDVGDHLPKKGGGWAEVIEAVRLPAPIWTYELESADGTRRSFDVNDTHAVMGTDGNWILVRDLVGGESVVGEHEPLTVRRAAHLKDDFYIAFTVEGHEYMFGGALCHNITTY